MRTGRAKLMRARKRFGRCRVHGHGHCEVNHEIQNTAVDRYADKRDIHDALEEASLEMQDTYMDEPV